MWTLSHYHEMRRECQIDNFHYILRMEINAWWADDFFFIKKNFREPSNHCFYSIKKKKNFFDLRIYPIPSSLSVCFMYLVKFMKIAHLQHPQQQHQPSNEHFESELNFPSKKFHEIFRLKFKNERILALNMAFFLVAIAG